MSACLEVSKGSTKSQEPGWRGDREPLVLLLQDRLPQQQGHPYHLISDPLVTENLGNLFQHQTLIVFLISPCQVLPEEEGLQARDGAGKDVPIVPKVLEDAGREG